MQIPLTSSARRISLALVSAILLSGYLWFAGRQFGAAVFSDRPDLASLQRATRWQPGNADYHDRLGRYFFLIQRSPEAAAQSYRAAVALNPFDAHYWFDLAAAYQWLGNTAQQGAALEHALAADSSTPDLAWEAANFYLVQGESEKALHEFRVVMENEANMIPPALALCWRLKPDIDILLRDAVPPTPTAYANLLDFLVTKKETSAAARVWTQLVQLQKPVTHALAFLYIRYLVSQHDVDQARLVWQQ
jgi:tetratricopeptide (TPR) repeat protein